MQQTQIKPSNLSKYLNPYGNALSILRELKKGMAITVRMTEYPNIATEIIHAFWDDSNKSKYGNDLNKYFFDANDRRNIKHIIRLYPHDVAIEQINDYVADKLLDRLGM